MRRVLDWIGRKILAVRIAWFIMQQDEREGLPPGFRVLLMQGLIHGLNNAVARQQQELALCQKTIEGLSAEREKLLAMQNAARAYLGSATFANREALIRSMDWSKPS